MCYYDVIFVSSRNRGTEQEREKENRPQTVQISVPSELVMDLLAQGAILQVQIGRATEARFGKACPQATCYK